MKIISLNVWGGTLRAPLIDFIMREAPSTDVFCFQEMYQDDVDSTGNERTRMNLYAEIAAVLPGFLGKFEAVVEGKGPGVPEHSSVKGGLAIFIKNFYSVVHGSLFVSGAYNTHTPEGPLMNWPTLLQHAEITGSEGALTVAHVHGLPYPGDKLDSPSRLAQSEAIVRWVRSQKTPVALLGDFNLIPQTKSIALLVEAPLRDLVAEYGVTLTRPMNHLLRYPEQQRQSFADYAFVSPQVKVKKFSVPEIEISDHLPLMLELEP